jgi:EAL domain-containing protein (putative c-di-GMP-specific phosphodiesterase class I)
MLGDDGELIPPGAFLHAAERHGLILEIDRWVLREAIRALAREQRAGHEVSLGINLSASSLIDPELPVRLARELDATGAAGSGLWLEVRETTAIVNVDRARTLAAGLADTGCKLAVDDFGAGFGSFYYLEHLEFEYVKIDGEFVTALRTNATYQLVVQSIVDIARGLGKRTIAEWVGDMETLKLLRSLGVDFAQGFLLGAPALLAGVDLSRPVAAPVELPAAGGGHPRRVGRVATRLH